MMFGQKWPSMLTVATEIHVQNKWMQYKVVFFIQYFAILKFEMIQVRIFFCTLQMSQDLQINWLYEQYGFSDIETFTLHPLNNQKMFYV